MVSVRRQPSRVDWRSLAMIAAVTTAVTLLFMQIEGPAVTAVGTYVSPSWAVSLHIGTVMPALLLGPVIFANRKGGVVHRRLGYAWMGMMVTTAVASFWIRSGNGTFSGIHLFSVGTLIAVPMAIWRARRRDINAHKQIMISLYVGLVVAGAFALDPSRVAGRTLWSVVSGG